MPRGRPRLPGTEAERAEARRARVRQNVQAFRARQRSGIIANPNDGPVVVTRSSSEESKTVEVHMILPPARRPGSLPAPTTTALVELVQYQNTTDGSSSSPDKISMTIPESPKVANAYRQAFLATLYDRFHPDIPASPIPHKATGLPRPADNYPCAAWIACACCSLGQSESEALSDASLAAALSVVGTESGRDDMVVEGLSKYLNALKKLRHDLFQLLKRPDDPKSDLSTYFLASFACAQVEMMCNNNLDNMGEHIKGIGSLIQRRGITGMLRLSDRVLLYEHRIMDNVFCMLSRKPSFLSLYEWINTPWKDSPDHQDNPVQTILDVAFLIPPLLEAFDKTIRLGNLDHRIQLVPEIEAVSQQMTGWLIGEVSKRDIGKYCEIPSIERKKPIWARCFTAPFSLIPWMMATSMIYWLPYKMTLLDMVIAITEEQLQLTKDSKMAQSLIEKLTDLRQELLYCGREVRRCMPHFIERERKLIGWVITLFPFQTTYVSFLKIRSDPCVSSKLSPAELNQLDDDLKWCRDLFSRYQEHGLRVEMIELYTEGEKMRDSQKNNTSKG